MDALAIDLLRSRVYRREADMYRRIAERCQSGEAQRGERIQELLMELKREKEHNGK